jgi:hypothetical protein
MSRLPWARAYQKIGWYTFVLGHNKKPVGNCAACAGRVRESGTADCRCAGICSVTASTPQPCLRRRCPVCVSTAVRECSRSVRDLSPGCSCWTRKGTGR